MAGALLLRRFQTASERSPCPVEFLLNVIELEEFRSERDSGAWRLYLCGSINEVVSRNPALQF
jgi:hypothetical protein